MRGKRRQIRQLGRPGVPTNDQTLHPYKPLGRNRQLASARCQAYIDSATDALADAPAEDLCQPTIEIPDIKPKTTDRVLVMSVVRIARNERTAIMTTRNKRKDLFKPSRSTKESKAAMTDRAARSILDAEAAKRQKKIEKLRNQRLAMEQREEKSG